MQWLTVSCRQYTRKEGSLYDGSALRALSRKIKADRIMSSIFFLLKHTRTNLLSGMRNTKYLRNLNAFPDVVPFLRISRLSAVVEWIPSACEYNCLVQSEGDNEHSKKKRKGKRNNQCGHEFPVNLTNLKKIQVEVQILSWQLFCQQTAVESCHNFQNYGQG